jgi:light-regulated signal transduction histidine kinase (bacteriophytochrome)
LRHIEGFSDLLLRGTSSPEQQRRQLQRISEAALRMGRLIDDLLAFSRLGRGDLRTQPVPLDRLVDEARRELQADTDGREVEWHIGELPEVMGDPGLLRLVMVNLLSNAIKYTRDREVARIEVGVASDDDETVAFVRDNGVGFDMQYAGKLFGVFQRLHHTNEFEGVGIGLANVRRIIHRHAGRTWAEGAPGEGATFFFALPKPRLPAADRALDLPTAEGEPGPETKAGAETADEDRGASVPNPASQLASE